MQGHKAWIVRGICAATMTVVVACSSKSAPELAQENTNDIATQNAAIDRQIPAVCLKVIETKLACLENKQAVDRVGGNTSDLLSDRVQLTEAEQDRTITLHNAILLRGPSATEKECKRWASLEIAGLTATQVPQIHAKGGDAAPCERAVEALRDTVASLAHQPGPVPGAARSEALSPNECDRLVRRSLFNLSFSSNDPTKAKFVATCVAGRDFYTRSYFNCVFAAKYSDAMDCAYAARGIDRSKTAPELAARQVGDDGSFQSSLWMVIAAVYKGQDPHTTLDQITRDQYLSKRDNILRSLEESPPADNHVPLRSSNSKIVANGLTYWVVHEDFHDVQLVKIAFDESKGSNSVICARYGSTEKLAVKNGFCAALIKKFLHTELAE
jgi:hypothetical protein